MKKTGFLIGCVLSAFQTFGMMSLISGAAEDAGGTRTEDAVQIFLSQDGSTVTGEGASISNNVVSISKGGTYRISGSLTEGSENLVRSGENTGNRVQEADGDAKGAAVRFLQSGPREWRKVLMRNPRSVRLDTCCRKAGMQGVRF